jgi:hypothetical protein
MMKRVIVITAAICLAFIVNAATAYTWRLVASYPVPVPNPRGYRVAGFGYGYIIEAGSIPYVYYFGLFTGSIISSFPAPGGAGAWGITDLYEESYISNNRTSWIYKVTSTGSVISSFRCPVPGPADMNRSWMTRYLEIAIPDRNVIAVVDATTGSLVSTFAGPGSRPIACCGYQTTLIVDAATHTVYENGVPVITGINTPVGADENFTTDYELWLYVVDDATDRIYWYERTLAVAPASLGRVKALFK